MRLSPLRFLIADDHAIVREGLRAIIQAQPGWELAGEAADGQEAIALALSLRPDVILLDLVMPYKDGLTAIVEIKRDMPQARILVLTGLEDDRQILPALKAGAMGYLPKDTPRQELLQAIQEVAGGNLYLSPPLASKMIKGLSHAPEATPPPSALTEREVDTLRLVAQGLTNEQIAWQLSISANTVARHVNGVLVKLGLSNRTQAALYALRHGLANLEESLAV